MSKFYPPVFKSPAYNCPHCGVYSKQNWFRTGMWQGGGVSELREMDVALCEHCSRKNFWYNEKMIVPDEGSIMLPNPDLPPDVIEDYNEARGILTRSPRGSAALLRLAIQKLCKHLGEDGKNINNDIANLVKKGLPAKVQQSLDILRVVGNNAVHPGQIDLKDNHDLAISLFGLINLIADVMITQPKHVDSLYGALPDELLKAIEQRDKNEFRTIATEEQMKKSIIAYYAGGILVLLVMVFMFTRPALFEAYNLRDQGTLGDAINGLTAPIIGLIR